jgi:hypothetical protein
VQHLVTYRLTSHPLTPELVTKAALVRFAARAEELGFAASGSRTTRRRRTAGSPTAVLSCSERSLDTM